MKKLYIETYGCQMNVADSEVVASVMQMAGYESTESLDEADAVFLNTCSVRDNAEQKIFHRLDALDAIKRKRPLIIGVLGCMAERVKEDLLENHHADLVAGPDAYLSLPDLIAQILFRVRGNLHPVGGCCARIVARHFDPAEYLDHADVAPHHGFPVGQRRDGPQPVPARPAQPGSPGGERPAAGAPARL